MASSPPAASAPASPAGSPPPNDAPTNDVPHDVPSHNAPPTTTPFIPPSILPPSLLSSASYTYHSPLPPALTTPNPPPCVLGIDEAGRGPVLGPMVYAAYYLPTTLEHPLLRTTHAVTDSKALTPSARAAFMRAQHTPDSPLAHSAGWAVRVLSARDIGAAQLRARGAENLNAQARTATVGLVRGVLARGVRVEAIFVDTVGPAEGHARALERELPGVRVSVAAKAESRWPCVAAASVCAKETRDAALGVLGEAWGGDWGSGYPGDARCKGWMRGAMDPVFGWGPECRFSWGTAKEMLEVGGGAWRVEWPEEEDDDNMRLTGFLVGAEDERGDELATWYGRRTTGGVF